LTATIAGQGIILRVLFRTLRLIFIGGSMVRLYAAVAGDDTSLAENSAR
jgi:hypothetical protein